MLSSISTRLPVAAAILASITLLGATVQGGSMYLRIPNLHAAPSVTGLSYDAVATVPKRPNTPASLLPVDTVEGSMTLTYAATTLRVDQSDFKGVTSFTVVQVNGHGAVTQRTSFIGVTVENVALVGDEDGSMARKITFRAQKVIVTNPTV